MTDYIVDDREFDLIPKICAMTDEEFDEYLLALIEKNEAEKMLIRQYDNVLLKDGRRAAIVEVFSERDFLADVGSSPKDWETIDITIDDIEVVLRSH